MRSEKPESIHAVGLWVEAKGGRGEGGAVGVREKEEGAHDGVADHREGKHDDVPREREVEEVAVT